MMEVDINVLMKRSFKDKIEWFSCNYDKEIAGWIMGTINGNSIILEDILIPEQEADSGSIEIDGKAVIKLRKEYGKKCEKIIGEWHSHHSIGAFWSSTDDDFIKQFSEPREICIFIVSSKDTHKIRVEVRKPFHISIDDLDYNVEEDDKLSKKLQKEIDKKVKVPERVGVSVGWNWGGNQQQTTLTSRKQYNLQVSRMIKFYNGINRITITDVPNYYAEDFYNQFQHLTPKIINDNFNEANIEILFKDKETAIKEMKEIRDYFINMLEELDEATNTNF